MIATKTKPYCCGEDRDSPFCPMCGSKLGRSRTVIEVPKDYHPLAYGYLRVSTDRQERSGLGLGAQDRDVEGYFRRVLSPAGVRWGTECEFGWGPGFFVDAISAFKREFAQRPSASRMLRVLNPGDHVVIAKHDRAFRRTLDMAVSIKYFREHKISLHIINMNFDSSREDPLSEAMLTNFVSFAQLESTFNSQRHKDANAIARLMPGRLVSGKAPLGYKTIRRRDGYFLVPDHEARKTIRFIVRSRNAGNSFVQISNHLVRSRVMWKKQNRKERSGYTWEFWDRWRCQSAYDTYMKTLEQEPDEKELFESGA